MSVLPAFLWKQEGTNNWSGEVLLPAPDAPTLTILSAASDTSPDFDVTGDVASGDTVRIFYSQASDMSGASSVSVVVGVGTFTLGPLAEGPWYYEADTTRSGQTSVRSNRVSHAIPISSAIPIIWYRAGSGAYNDAGSTLATNTQTVQQWNDQSGNARHAAQATSGNRPQWLSAIPSVSFDGTDDYLRYAAAGLSDTTAGSVFIAFQTGATAFATRGAQVLISSADEGTTNVWFEIGIGADGRIYIESNAAGTKHTLVGSSTLDVSSNYALFVSFDGTDWFASLNGVEQNPLTISNTGTFAWFGGVSGADNHVIGGTVTSAGLVRPFLGKVMEVARYSTDIT